MLDFPRWKVWSVSLLCLIGILLAVPSFVPEAQVTKWPSFLPTARINLGLDLAGGSHLLLEGDTSDVAKQRLDQIEDLMRLELRRASPRIEVGDMSTAGGRLSFLVRDPTRVDAAVEIARNQTQPVGLGGQRTWDVSVVDSTRVVLTPTASGLAEALDNAMSSAREVVYNRVDPEGTKEVTVIRQGKDRILVQVPGLRDPEGLKALLGKTARLEFKMVAPDQSGVQTGRAVPGTQILPMQDGGRIAVVRRAMVSGDQLIEATQAFDQTTNEPVVNIRFDSRGSHAFARVTRENVGKPFAIVLDDIVLSAPNINEPILGGSAQISGSFTVKTATDLAVQLASGALPVELKVIEERSVGPDLGKDSIEKAVIAGMVGTVAILLFMSLTYGRFGIYADIALILNVLVILGIMAPFATLTLPGIAGFVLTVGAAVDANVIINERIREEQRRGRRVLDAIEHGYNEARTAIFDANITNVIAGVLLYYFGSGPVKGFAVVMMIGIATSVFTAVTVTRMFVSIWLRKRPTELVI
ncbi:MAG TPA: protein translocase subunit SecD [Allosphingosinicella sp.]|nr:protein translocase subunit SecD [Allosphingosinicella sp.]